MFCSIAMHFSVGTGAVARHNSGLEVAVTTIGIAVASLVGDGVALAMISTGLDTLSGKAGWGAQAVVIRKNKMMKMLAFFMTGSILYMRWLTGLSHIFSLNGLRCPASCY